jgi:hypothetical protein
MKISSLTKSQLITKIVEDMFPHQPIKQSLEITAIDKCGYTKAELLIIAKKLN